ncbi:DUF1707 SHOCT-like domain-containing protein [Actinomadura macrotermitis]|uniref:DUF1707 domain-containing protein n=1 Tax=Actinomadura macrotermitis TaxID=2585200 RepID=A0A7K0C7Y0_9ACTN|nr:DUF1707 domain-containing protein [Actinomadura macrotermitis]MQY09557.1 hypothetical protein [Actinomadura macrotermitis]
MTNLPEMRASDADRDRVAAILRDAAGDGRLDLDELEERLEAVYAAKTYAELEPITSDLPATGSAHAVPYVPPPGAPAGDLPSWSTGVGVLGEFHRQGEWSVPPAFTAFSFWGGGKIDLRDARFQRGEVRIRAFAIMGGIEIIAADDMTVHVKGIGIMGGFPHRASGPGAAGAPKVTVTGFAFWGGVDTKRKARKQRRLRKGGS